MNIIEANVATPDTHVAIAVAHLDSFINGSPPEGTVDVLKRID